MLLCLASSTAALSQQAPTFFLKVPNDNRAKNGLLSFYLDYLSIRYVSRNFKACTPSSMGIFRFVVTRKATIDSVYFSGSMPVEAINDWKRVIKESAVGWKPATRNGKPIDTPMVFCFYYKEMYTEEGECPNYPKGGRLPPSFSLYFDLLLDLFKDGQEMIPAKNGYLIRPAMVSDIR